MNAHGLTSLWETEGLKRLLSATEKQSFCRLAPFFRMQTDWVSCGPTSASIVLNALRYNTNAAPVTQNTLNKKRTLNAYTPESFLPSAKLTESGMSMQRLADHLEQYHRVQVTQYEVSTPSPLYIRYMRSLLCTEGTYLIANYDRKTLKQNGSGHFSPVGAYDSQTDSFLVMDVNPATGPWLWVPALLFLEALNTYDSGSQCYRGFLSITDTAG